MQPAFFINHGGGPCFLLEPGPMHAAWSELGNCLCSFMGKLGERPRAILVLSGHWEEAAPAVNAGAHPPLLYDYGGFPDFTYHLTWPAPGAPDVASRVRQLLSAARVASGSEAKRGWDHGVFVPLTVMLPDAELPVVQLSLQRGRDPAAHPAIGRALKPLREEGVLILGRGQTYQNMRGFFSGGGEADPAAEAFDEWLRDAMIDGASRDDMLIRWEAAPGARDAQPHEDHLLPLKVAAGAASGEPGSVHFDGRALGKPISGFRFG